MVLVIAHSRERAVKSPDIGQVDSLGQFETFSFRIYDGNPPPPTKI